ncbi:unnamed protein product [Notodromas monacha]|uniref:AH domain-containing protein n=1 Tax=Notodromas monacha TaxID=399045 RepID=A0A7R9BJN4_9CRUS|nr:unnamed protein product [Notodromas monacha]CAG0916733.1 unnamed protein product [Notodromas monacha]
MDDDRSAFSDSRKIHGLTNNYTDVHRGFRPGENVNLRLNLTPPLDEEYGEDVSADCSTSDVKPAYGELSPVCASPSARTPIFAGSPVSPFNGDLSPVVTRPGDSKIDAIKKWSISTFKCTKQILSEKLGKTSRTVDSELEPQIDQLRDTHRRYLNILRLAKAMASHFSGVVQTQHVLGEAFADLAQKSPELQEEFLYNADTQRNLTKNGETLLGALNFFISSLNTLCNKTIEDTLMTIRDYETARVEFDAYRTDMERVAQEPKSDASAAKMRESQQMYDSHRNRYEKLRGNVSVKLKFLHENRVKVMHKQLLLFHNAISAYFSGNQANLEATLKQFNIKLQSPNAGMPSWLEK